MVLGETSYLSFKDGLLNKSKAFKNSERKISYGPSYIEVEYKFDGAYLKEIPDENTHIHTRIFMDDAKVYICPGQTVGSGDTLENLPYYKDLLVLNEFADNSSVEIEILEESHKDYLCVIGLEDKKDYPKNIGTPVNGDDYVFLPDSPVKKVSTGTFRTIPFSTVNTYPLIYSAHNKTLRCYSYIKYRVTYKEQETKAYLSQLSYDILKTVASNPENLENYDKISLQSEASSKRCDYLIVTIDDYKVAAEKIATWKSRLGYKCHIISKPNWKGGYKEYVGDQLREYYSETPYKPDYLLVIGSNSDVTSYRVGDKDGYPSDLNYTQYTTNSSNKFDNLIKGRISVHNQKNAISVVDKIISYESNPPLDPDFYNDVLSIALYQFDNHADQRESRYFDFISSIEGISEDLTTLGYNIERHYKTEKDSRPQYFYFGNKMPDEMYTEDLSTSTFWNQAPSHITEEINKGKSIVIFRGHGDPNCYNDNVYPRSEAAKLNNGNKTPVIFNFTCNTGNFSVNNKRDSLCLSEFYLNKENSGAVGVFGNTNPTNHGESNEVAASTFEALFSNRDISIAQAILEASLKTELVKTREIGHWFGDPTMKLYTKEPAKFSPYISRKGSTITVNTRVKGTKVTICSIADMGKSYFRTINLTDKTNVSFENVDVPCYVTITKANYVPYVTVSQTEMYLQNMTLNGGHDIVTEKITTGSDVTKDQKSGSFVVESGETKLTASKSLSLKSGTSIKSGASFSAKLAQAKVQQYEGDGEPRQSTIPLCFITKSNRFNDEIYIYDGGNVGNNGQITSVADNSPEFDYKIYPNPTSGHVNVVSNSEINEVVVLDMTGNVMMSESAHSNKVSLDLSSLAKGMYIVKVVTDENSNVSKIVLK